MVQLRAHLQACRAVRQMEPKTERHRVHRKADNPEVQIPLTDKVAALKIAELKIMGLKIMGQEAVLRHRLRRF